LCFSRLSFSFRERKGAKETFFVPLRFSAAQSFEIPACLKRFLMAGRERRGSILLLPTPPSISPHRTIIRTEGSPFYSPCPQCLRGKSFVFAFFVPPQADNYFGALVSWWFILFCDLVISWQLLFLLFFVAAVAF
jgi:hypothetical protein